MPSFMSWNIVSFSSLKICALLLPEPHAIFTDCALALSSSEGCGENMPPEGYNAPPKCAHTLPLGRGKKKPLPSPLASAAWSAETDCPQ